MTQSIDLKYATDNAQFKNEELREIFLLHKKTLDTFSVFVTLEQYNEIMNNNALLFIKELDSTISGSTQKQHTIPDLTPEITSTKTNMNLSELKQDSIEIKPETPNDTHKSTRGGRRVGAGRKKGQQPKLSESHKAKISESMKNNQNARKYKHDH